MTRTQARPNIKTNERLIVALDVPSVEDAQAMVKKLGDDVTFYKLGLGLFMAGDYFGLLEWLCAHDKKVFVDLKFFDIPETVGAAVTLLSKHKVEFATVHGDDKILKAATTAAKAANSELKVLAVTVLTSLDEDDLQTMGFQGSVEDLVMLRARSALDLGCAGVVASGQEAAGLRDIAKMRQFVIVTPGIRLRDTRNTMDNPQKDDQKRTMDAEQAIASGADYIVVGRPIINASDPRKVARMIQEQIKHAVSGETQ